MRRRLGFEEAYFQNQNFARLATVDTAASCVTMGTETSGADAKMLIRKEVTEAILGRSHKQRDKIRCSLGRGTTETWLSGSTPLHLELFRVKELVSLPLGHSLENTVSS